MPTTTLGLATTFHDPAIAVVSDAGEVLFAEASERPLGLKRAPMMDPDAPDLVAGLLRRYADPGDDIVVATSWGPEFSGFLARLAAAGQFAPEAVAALPITLNRSMVPERAERGLVAGLHHAQARAGLGAALGLMRAHGHGRIRLRRYPHHLCHAAFAAAGCPFEEAAVLVVDGMGEAGASAIYRYAGGSLTEVKRHRGRESLGFFFGLITDLCGFDQAKGEEWKVMGLAPYGRRDPALAGLLGRLYRIEGHRIVFADAATVNATAAAVLARRPPDPEEQGWADLARAGQDAFEAMMGALVAEAARLVPSRNLVLGGGCALNSSYNGRVLERTGFEALFVPSAPADDGNAVGAALLSWHEDHPGAPLGHHPISAYLGSTVDPRPLERAAAHDPGMRRLSEPEMIEEVADRLARGELVGWAMGRAEYGPRALGNRSILADPRPAGAKDAINAKVKYRERFRPFAPAILAEAAGEWFEDAAPSPHMERTLRWRAEKRALVPACVHEDGTGRLQTVTREANPLFHALISAFAARTGVPVLLNTSFNVMGKPILHGAEDAVLMARTTGLDAVAVGEWLIARGLGERPAGSAPGGFG